MTIKSNNVRIIRYMLRAYIKYNGECPVKKQTTISPMNQQMKVQRKGFRGKLCIQCRLNDSKQNVKSAHHLVVKLKAYQKAYKMRLSCRSAEKILHLPSLYWPQTTAHRCFQECHRCMCVVMRYTLKVGGNMPQWKRNKKKIP